MVENKLNLLKKILDMRKKGKTYKEIQTTLHCGRPNISFAIRNKELIEKGFHKIFGSYTVDKNGVETHISENGKIWHNKPLKIKGYFDADDDADDDDDITWDDVDDDDGYDKMIKEANKLLSNDDYNKLSIKFREYYGSDLTKEAINNIREILISRQ